jgi:hypothetical protein
VRTSDLINHKMFDGTKAQAEALYVVTAPQLEGIEQYVLCRFLRLDVSEKFQRNYEFITDREYERTLKNVISKLPEEINL